jgi:hypothetical protein
VSARGADAPKKEAPHEAIAAGESQSVKGGMMIGRVVSISGVLAMLLLGALSAGSASALESTWLVDGAKSAVAVPTDSTFTLEFEDTKAGPFGESVALVCEGADQGTVGPGLSDTITAITLIKCKTSKLCSESPEPTATFRNYRGAPK